MAEAPPAEDKTSASFMQFIWPSKKFREVDLFVVFVSLMLIFIVFPGSLEEYGGFLFKEHQTVKQESGSQICICWTVLAALLSVFYTLTPNVPDRTVSKFMIISACGLLAFVSVYAFVDEVGGYLAYRSSSIGLLSIPILLILPILALVRAIWLWIESNTTTVDLFVYDDSSLKEVFLALVVMLIALFIGKWVGLSPIITFLFMVESTRIVRRN